VDEVFAATFRAIGAGVVVYGGYALHGDIFKLRSFLIVVYWSALCIS